MLFENQLIYTGLEATEGTDPTLSSTDFLAVHNISVSPNLTYNDTQAQDGSLSPRAGTLGQKYIEVSFDHELQVNNSSKTLPPCDALLQACGWDDNEESTTNGKYYPTSPRGLKCHRLAYDAGQDGEEPSAGDTVTGATSSATGTLEAYTIQRGDFDSDNDAAGVLYLSGVSGGPFTDDEDLEVSSTKFAEANGVEWFPTVTLYVYQEDILWKISGCRGDVSFNCVAGEPAILSFTLTGEYAKPTDDTFPTSWTDDGGAPLVAMGGTFAFGGNNPTINNLTFGLNNTVSVLPSASDTHAVSAVHITDRAPEATIDPEMVKASSIDHWTPYEAVTQQSLSYALTNSTVDVDITLPQTEIKSIGSGDRDGINIWDITLGLARSGVSAGEDEASIQFSAT